MASMTATDDVTGIRRPSGLVPYYETPGVCLYKGDCLEVMSAFPDECFDMVFADPPYHLSNDGVTCHAGRMVSVNKGEWDRSRAPERDHEFVMAWLSECRRLMKRDATIWVCGTHHIRPSGCILAWPRSLCELQWL